MNLGSTDTPQSRREEEGVGTKQHLPARERITIGKLIYATTCSALAFSVYPLTDRYPASWIGCLMVGLLGSAIGNTRAGTEGAVVGFIFGLLLIPIGTAVWYGVNLPFLTFFVAILVLRAFWKRRTASRG